jgi:hypothetical protein
MNRQVVLSSLIQFSQPVARLKSELASFPWDADQPIVTLTKDDLIAILQRFAANEFDADTLEGWANLVECREDIEFESGHSEVISDAIFQLTNPMLCGPLVTMARKIISNLR